MTEDQHESAGQPEAANTETQSIRIESSGSGPVLVLKGEIGFEAAAGLRLVAERLLANGGAVGVDWADAGHVCAGAIQVLLALRIGLAARGQACQVVRDNPGVRRFLRISGLSEHFPLGEQAA